MKKEKNKKQNNMENSQEKKINLVEKVINSRGRIFEGIVIKKFPKRIVLLYARTIYVRKYERYAKSRTKIHARLPNIFEKEINIGDLIQIQECRPLSKMIHFVVIKKIKDKGDLK